MAPAEVPSAAAAKAPTKVHANIRLSVTYSFHEASTAKSQGVIAVHHGICHTREHYQQLIEALNQRGFDVLMIDQQSEAAGFFRNAIGLKAYVRGMQEAVKQFQGDWDLPIVAYVLHSMGALIGETMQQQYPELRRPTVLLAPIPASGAWPVTLRIMRRDPGAYLMAVLTLNLLRLGRTATQVRKLFFDRSAAELTVEDTKGHLKHSPFWAYCRLVLRPLLGPWIHGDQPPKLLLYSNSDHIFRPKEYKAQGNTSWRNQFKGGHDFFMEQATATAERIAIFIQQHPLPLDIVDNLRIDLPVPPRPRRPYILKLRDLARAMWRGVSQQIRRMRGFGSR